MFDISLDTDRILCGFEGDTTIADVTDFDLV